MAAIEVNNVQGSKIIKNPKSRDVKSADKSEKEAIIA